MGTERTPRREVHKVYDLYAPLFAKLTPAANEQIRKGT
jgi:hypothetical protein